MNYRSLIRERKRGSRRGEKQVAQEKQKATVREKAEGHAAMAACLSWTVTEKGATRLQHRLHNFLQPRPSVASST